MRLPSGENEGSAWMEWLSCHASVGSFAAPAVGGNEKHASARLTHSAAWLRCDMAAPPADGDAIIEPQSCATSDCRWLSTGLRRVPARAFLVVILAPTA